MNKQSSGLGRLASFVSVCAILIVVGKAAFESPVNSRDLAWQTNCKASLARAEAALTNPARPTQIAQRIRDLPSEYRAASTRDVVRFLVSYWSAREDLQAAFTGDSGELDMEAMVGWTRDGVDSTAVALVPCADQLAKLPGMPSVQSSVPEIVRWARGRVRWQADVDDAAYVAADYIRNDPDLVKAARKKPSLAFVAAASVPPDDPRYQSMWAYQSMFDLLLRANP